MVLKGPRKTQNTGLHLKVRRGHSPCFLSVFLLCFSSLSCRPGGPGGPVGPVPPIMAARTEICRKLQTSLAPGVCTQDREIRTEAVAGRRRARVS